MLNSVSPSHTPQNRIPRSVQSTMSSPPVLPILLPLQSLSDRYNKQDILSNTLTQWNFFALYWRGEPFNEHLNLSTLLDAALEW